MALARNLVARRFHSLLEPQNMAFFYHIIHSNSPPSHHRPFASSSSQTLAESDGTHTVKSLHSLFNELPKRRSDPKNEKLKGKSKQAETVGLSDKTGDKECEVGRVKEVEKKKADKNLRKSKELKLKLIQEEAEVVQGELQGKRKQGETVGLSDKAKQKESEVGRVKDIDKKKPGKKLGESKVKFVEEEKEVVQGELQGKPKQGEAVSLSEKTERKKSEVRGVEDERRKPKKKLKRPKKWKVNFIEEEEQPKKPEPKRLYDLFIQGEKVNFMEEEEVVKVEQPKKPEPKRLYDMFSQGEKKWNQANPRRSSPGIAPVKTQKEVKQREPPLDLKKLSSDMKTFMYYLYKGGYFRDASFVKDKKYDPSWFDIEYARYYTLSAVQKFGRDKQEISKWLSGSDLKQVAMFGCPSSNKSQVFPSKRLRNYFRIPENKVCSGCVLRDSCKFVNRSVWGHGNNHLDLSIAMKVICTYAMSLVDPQLVVPDEVNKSVNRLLKEVLKLSQTF